MNLQTQAIAWIEKNPEAMALFEKYAMEKVLANKKFGIGQLTERVRWEEPINTHGDDFKINNNYRAYIARWLIEKHPDIKEYITIRETSQNIEKPTPPPLPTLFPIGERAKSDTPIGGGAYAYD